MSLFLDWSSFHSIKQAFWSQGKVIVVRVKGIFVIEKANIQVCHWFWPCDFDVNIFDIPDSSHC